MTSSDCRFTERRLQLLANGYLPIPVSSPDPQDPQCGKRPVLKGWAEINAMPSKADNTHSALGDVFRGQGQSTTSQY
jgi:hypothetical protein